MDKFNDFLTVFFVNNNNNKSNNKPDEKLRVKRESVKKASVKKASVKKASLKKASLKKASLKKEHKKADKKSKESDEKSKESDILSSLVSDCSFSSYSHSHSHSHSHSQSKINANVDENVDNTFMLKKYILKPSEFYKKNILITNDNKKDNFDIISDILYKLSHLKDVNNIYSDDIYIFTPNANRKMFKQMLLDNPYLYFTNFYVKQKIQKNSPNEENKKTIYIIDATILDQIDDIDKFLDPQIHLILLTSENDKIINFYNKLGDERILIHKQDKLKSIQKRFFKYVIKQINEDVIFEDFYNEINNENIDVKYIVLKENEIRYN